MEMFGIGLAGVQQDRDQENLLRFFKARMKERNRFGISASSFGWSRRGPGTTFVQDFSYFL